ncbi:MAG: hypothetical protein ACE5F1_15385 [Planctomycetota bacterium]
MKTILLAALGLGTLTFAGWRIYRATVSVETRVRWVLDRCVEAFNDRAMLSLTSSLDYGYVDTKTGFGLTILQRALLHVAQRRVDPATKRFLYRLLMPEDSVISEAGESGKASADFVLELHRGLDERERLPWKLEVHAELQESDGEWLLVRSAHETLEGMRPGR